jgi:hypothetical protein
MWNDSRRRGERLRSARRVLGLAVLAGVGLAFVALVVTGGRGPTIVARPTPAAVGKAPVSDSPPRPAAPPDVERPKRESAVAMLRGGEDVAQYTERLLRRARGLEEGIERMFARDLEEEEKRRLFELGLGPVAQAEALPATVSPEARARIAQRLVSLASDQFAQARRLQKDRRPGEPVFENLLQGASRFHAASQTLFREALETKPSKG